MAAPTQEFLNSLIPAQTSGVVNPAALTRRLAAAIPSASISIGGTTVSVTIADRTISASLAGTATFGAVSINASTIDDANASKIQTGETPT